jgi:hypothetical protein
VRAYRKMRKEKGERRRLKTGSFSERIIQRVVTLAETQ